MRMRMRRGCKYHSKTGPSTVVPPVLAFEERHLVFLHSRFTRTRIMTTGAAEKIRDYAKLLLLPLSAAERDAEVRERKREKTLAFVCVARGTYVLTYYTTLYEAELRGTVGFFSYARQV